MIRKRKKPPVNYGGPLNILDSYAIPDYTDYFVNNNSLYLGRGQISSSTISSSLSM